MYQNTQQFPAPECYPSATISSRGRTMWIFIGIHRKTHRCQLIRNGILAIGILRSFVTPKQFAHFHRIECCRECKPISEAARFDESCVWCGFSEPKPHSAWLILHHWERALCECGNVGSNEFFCLELDFFAGHAKICDTEKIIQIESDEFVEPTIYPIDEPHTISMETNKKKIRLFGEQFIAGWQASVECSVYESSEWTTAVPIDEWRPKMRKSEWAKHPGGHHTVFHRMCYGATAIADASNATELARRKKYPVMCDIM